MKEFSFSTRIYFGEGALARLRQVEGRRVFLVTDKFMVTSGVADRVASYLTDCQVTVYSDVVPDPPITNVVSGVQALLASGADVMIALGGGSAIDAAKAIRAVAADTPGVGEIREAFAIPTTSGTGSEVTDYSVITDPEKGVKYPLTDKTLQPPVAILDPELVVTVPAAITADTGMDVLTHAVEAYVSTGFNDFSDAMAEKAVSLVCRWLPVAYADGKNLLAREKMHNASCMAGLAFNSAGLGLVHGIAHALGAKLHLPHGRANAIVLPHVLRYNAELQDPKGGDYSLPARKYQRAGQGAGPAARSHRPAGSQQLHPGGGDAEQDRPHSGHPPGGRGGYGSLPGQPGRHHPGRPGRQVYRRQPPGPHRGGRLRHPGRRQR